MASKEQTLKRATRKANQAVERAVVELTEAIDLLDGYPEQQTEAWTEGDRRLGRIEELRDYLESWSADDTA